MVANSAKARLPRRGRPLRTAARGFGAFLDSVMRLQHAMDAPGEGFMEYMARLYARRSKSPGVSLRHLMRLRAAFDIPSFSTLARIAEAFPAFGEFEESQPEQRRFKEELWIPRLGWSAIREIWNLLPAGSDISLCMGLVPSWAVERITGPIAHDIGLAIVDPRRDLKFNLVFPQAPRDKAFLEGGKDRELTAPEILQDLQLSIVKAILRTGSDSAAVRNRIRTRLSAWEVTPSAEAMYFWSRCPRALMISNLFGREHGKGDFAAAYELNQVPYPASFVDTFHPPLPAPLTSAGWGFLLPQSHQRLLQIFHKLLASKTAVRRCAL
jgi:hypothetical protein